MSGLTVGGLGAGKVGGLGAGKVDGLYKKLG